MPISVPVNAPEAAVTLDIAALCTTPQPDKQSPIDRFYEHVATLVTKTAIADVASDPTLMRLLLIEVVSAAEFYFRTVLSSVLRVCPLARSAAAKQPVSMHAVGYYDLPSLGFGIYEGRSLSGETGVKKYTQSVLGIPIPDSSSTGTALLAFETICQLRHAVVHAQGHLWSNNALEIGLEIEHPSVVDVKSASFQQISAVATNAIRAYNRFVCEAVIQRWVSKKHLTGVWSDDRDHFEALYSLFRSEKDATSPRSSYNAYRRIRSAILARA